MQSTMLAQNRIAASVQRPCLTSKTVMAAPVARYVVHCVTCFNFLEEFLVSFAMLKESRCASRLLGYPWTTTTKKNMGVSHVQKSFGDLLYVKLYGAYFIDADIMYHHLDTWLRMPARHHLPAVW